MAKPVPVTDTPPDDAPTAMGEPINEDGMLKPKALARLKADLTEEYRALASEANAGIGPAVTRRHEIARRLRGISAIQHVREPDVSITVGRSPTGHPYMIGERAFPPGDYMVKGSVAQTLFFLMSKSAQIERERLQSNGQDVVRGRASGGPLFSRDDSRQADLRTPGANFG